MTDELLPYYNRELAHIRQLGVEFAKAHPKIAGRLRWAGDTTEDPHVARMIEAFAFLNARTRHKLDDDFPEVSAALLGILYPHYLAPMPSAAIVECRLAEQDAELTAGYHLPRGSSVETELIEGQPCRFRTCYDTTLWPVDIATAAYQSQPFAAPVSPVSRIAAAVLRIELKTWSPKVSMADLQADRLRFYLHGGSQEAFDLYELIHNNCLGVAFGSLASATFVNDAIGMVGFERDEGLCDYSPRSFLGYRLLSEFFSFPQKFLFFDIAGIPRHELAKARSERLEIFLYLDRHLPDLERFVDQHTLRLGCVPIVNLYRQRAEPIRWTHTQFEYRIVPDARRPAAHEIYSVDRVMATSPRNEELEFQPFYSIQHGMSRETTAYWHTRREPAGYAAGRLDRGTEVYLSLVDLDFKPAALADWTIDLETTCVNRDLPSRLPFGGGQPALHFTGKASVARVQCLTAPTPTRRPTTGQQNLWRLISHLTLGHLSLVDSPQGAEALREILRLYDPTEAPENLAMIAGVRSITSRRVVSRVPGGAAAGFCRGVEVTLQLDEDQFIGSSAFLFGAVLERFLALYSSINSFTKTVVTSTRRATPLRVWRPRVGEQILL
jgi:type VI secretion system protein ImpG